MQTLLLAVGISQYQSDQIKDLTVCDRDAQAVAAAFASIAGNALQQHLLLNEQATKAQIKEGIAWLAQTAHPGDLAIFYYSGHGASNPADDNESGEEDHNDEFLCPHDCGTELGLATFIRDDELRAWLSAVSKQTNQLVVILDSCHSGTAAMAPRHAIAKELPPEIVSTLMGDAKSPKRNQASGSAISGQVLLAACQDDEQSYIVSGASNSVFTTHMLEALQDTTITTFQQLYIQVVPQVTTQLEPLSLQQNPNLVDGTGGKLVFR